MPLPVRPHRDTAPSPEGTHVIYVSTNASNDPHLEFLPEEPGDVLPREPVFIIEPVPRGPSRHVAQRRPQDQLLERGHVLRVLDPRTIRLAVLRRVMATLLAAHRVVTGALLALRAGVVRTYGVPRRMTSQLAHWTWRSGARVLEGMTAISMSGLSRCRRVAGDLTTRGSAFWRLCRVATRLVQARLNEIIRAIERVMPIVGRHVSLAVRSLHQRGGASLRVLVRNVPSSRRLVMQIPLSVLDIRRVRLPMANSTVMAFSGGTAIGACIMWLVGVLPAAPSLTTSGVTLASGIVAPGPPADDRAATVDSATPVTTPVEPQEEGPSSVSARTTVTATAITVTSVPAGARVTVDDIGWGETPVTIHHLPSGQKVIRVTKEGYESQQRIISVADARRSAAVRVTLRARN